MKNHDCIFCKIINKEIPSKVIFENEYLLVIEDISPKAPVHYLVMPKKHIINLMHIEESDSQIMWELLREVKKLSQDLDDPKAFNLISNNGEGAGQSVNHFHFHFLAGKNLYGGDFKL